MIFSNNQIQKRSIHEIFQAFLVEKAHGYCAFNINAIKFYWHGASLQPKTQTEQRFDHALSP
jgi:hypothetical protein